MMKQIFRPLMVLLILLTVASLSAQDRGASLTTVAADNLGSSVSIGKQYALLIAIDAYRSWPALNMPVADAREIRDILREQYYIDEFIELYNHDATKENIIKNFTELQGRLEINDSLFVYYAGHGHLDPASDGGFWIPVDGGTNEYSQENWLSNSQIRGYISRFRTIHVFLVSDACFSGDILNTPRALPPAIDNTYFRRAYSLVSRQVLTSGSIEKVPDKSEFSNAFKICLRKNNAFLLDPIGIYDDVRRSVEKTTPLYGTLNQANHQEGATFLFFRRQAVGGPSADPSVAQIPVTLPVSASAVAGNITVGVQRVPSQTPVSKALHDQSKAKLVFIRPGTFTMGSPNDEQGRATNEPQRRITIEQGFYIDKYEVIQKDWVSIMGNNPSKFKKVETRPVENVSFYDAINYCNQRSQKEGLTSVYAINGTEITWNRTANGYRLPTEEEWEYACRARTTTPFFTGNNITTDQANYDGSDGNAKGRFREETWSVGSGKANGFGLYDMAGNVWEWCWTIDDGIKRVARGGSWYNRVTNLRSARRQSLDPDYYSDKTGFRVVLQQQQ